MLVKPQTSERPHDCLFGLSFKIGFGPIWPCGRGSEGVRQADNRGSNLGLSSDFLCLCCPVEQNDTSMGGAAGRAQKMQEVEERQMGREVVRRRGLI